MTRRDPRRAELYRRLNAYEPPSPPHLANSPAPPPAEVPREEEEPSSPPLIQYWRIRYWEFYRALKGTNLNPRNSLPHPAENTIHPSPEKRQMIVSDKDGEQCDVDSHSSECAYQTVVHKLEEVDGGEHEQGTNNLSVPCKRRRQRSLSIAAYVAQCAACEKWRLVPQKEKYEELRTRIKEDPFTCEKAHDWKPDVTCNDPSDVSQDGSWLWAMDQHNIPQPPPGFERLIAIRGEGGTRFADVYYSTPTGKKLRSSKEIENYLKENPEHGAHGVNLSQFSFKIPAPAPQDRVGKRAKMDQNDGLHRESSETNQPVLMALCRKVLPMLPIAWSAPPMLEVPGANNQLAPYNVGPPELHQPEPPEMKLGNPPQQSAV